MRGGLPSYLSANYPALWAVRADVSLLLALALPVLGLAVIFGAVIALEMFLGPQWKEGAHIIVHIANGLLYLSALFALTSAAGRARYAAVSPRMIGYPRLIDFYLASLPLTLGYGCLVWLTVVTFVEGTVFEAKIGSAVAAIALFGNVVIASAIYVAYHGSFKVMALTYLGLSAVFMTVSVVFSYYDGLNRYLRIDGEIGTEVLGANALVWLFLFVSTMRSGRIGRLWTYIGYALIFFAPVTTLYFLMKISKILGDPQIVPDTQGTGSWQLNQEMVAFAVILFMTVVTLVLVHYLSRRLAAPAVLPN